MFTSENELSTFSFRDATIDSLQLRDNQVIFSLTGAIVKSDNSNNTNFTDSYAKDLTITLEGADILKTFKEGYKYYDANEVLVNQVPDEPISLDDFKTLTKSFEGTYLYASVDLKNKKDTLELADANPDKEYYYGFAVEVNEEDTYWFTVAFDKSIAAWESYLNRVQY